MKSKYKMKYLTGWLLHICILINLSCSNQKMADNIEMDNASETGTEDTHYSFEKIIPEDRKIYLIGEVHMDLKEMTLENLEYIKKTTAIEDSIHHYLVEQCGVTQFMFEIPSCWEIFYSIYLQTGDTTWIHDILDTEQYFLYYRLKYMRNLIILHPDVKVSCIDANYRKYADKVEFAMVTTTFYNLNPTEFYPPYVDNKDIAIPVSANLNQCIWLLKNDSINITPLLRPFFTNLIIYTVEGNAADTKLYDMFVGAFKNDALIDAFKKFYKNDFDYIMRMMRNYIYGYQYPEINSAMLQDRDNFLFPEIVGIINKNQHAGYCLQLGMAHTDTTVYHNMVRSRLLENKYQPFCVQLMPQNFNEILTNTLQLPKALDYNFKGNYLYNKKGFDDVQLLIK